MNTLRAPAVRYPRHAWASHVYGSQVPCRVVVPSGASPSIGEATRPTIPTTVAATTATAATTKMTHPRPERRRAGRAEGACGGSIVGLR